MVPISLVLSLKPRVVVRRVLAGPSLLVASLMLSTAVCRVSCWAGGLEKSQDIWCGRCVSHWHAVGANFVATGCDGLSAES